MAPDHNIVAPSSPPTTVRRPSSLSSCPGTRSTAITIPSLPDPKLEEIKEQQHIKNQAELEAAWTKANPWRVDLPPALPDCQATMYPDWQNWNNAQRPPPKDLKASTLWGIKDGDPVVYNPLARERIDLRAPAVFGLAIPNRNRTVREDIVQSYPPGYAVKELQRVADLQNKERYAKKEAGKEVFGTMVFRKQQVRGAGGVSLLAEGFAPKESFTSGAGAFKEQALKAAELPSAFDSDSEDEEPELSKTVKNKANAAKNAKMLFPKAISPSQLPSAFSDSEDGEDGEWVSSESSVQNSGLLA